MHGGSLAGRAQPTSEKRRHPQSGLLLNTNASRQFLIFIELSFLVRFSLASWAGPSCCDHVDVHLKGNALAEHPYLEGIYQDVGMQQKRIRYQKESPPHAIYLYFFEDPPYAQWYLGSNHSQPIGWLKAADKHLCADVARGWEYAKGGSWMPATDDVTITCAVSGQPVSNGLANKLGLTAGAFQDLRSSLSDTSFGGAVAIGVVVLCVLRFCVGCCERVEEDNFFMSTA